MPRRRNPPQEFLQDITVDDDGVRPVREAHQWSRDKLGILASYLQAFTTASRRAPATCFVDGMAGPGLYQFADGSHVLGSTPIALETLPAFTRCLALERNQRAVQALEQRTAKYGYRAVVRRGDCNAALIPLMREHVPPRAATLVFLDPEGYDLDFNTVRRVADFRRGRKVELLVLVDSGSFQRTAMARLQSEPESSGPWRFDWALPLNWRALVERFHHGELTPDDLREMAADLFCQKLREQLHYRHAFHRRITRSGRDRAAIYHLAFATDNDAGERIMRDVFESMYSNVPPPPLRLPGL